MKICEHDGCSNRARINDRNGNRGRYCEKHHRLLHPKSEAYYKRKQRRSLCRKYKLTTIEYIKIKQDQDNRCAICGDKTKLVVDHCHVTDQVRGMLCSKCNTGIGLLKNSSEILIRASNYVINYGKKTRMGTG